ncbi:MAG: S-adenosylmethionine:tRNA ribosyltransferase-isomerase [Candidatus Promineifilaceae bacterium]|nr:S-adenosylmethionine:tRNA ribosyltransferase-isomerase [Candidatus Promineifilaceae bacterium]
MKRQELIFDRPQDLVATLPAEEAGMARDNGRLLVSISSAHTHARFRDLAQFLRSGDLLVVNRSATLPASLAAVGSVGEFMLNLSTDYGNGLWLAEPRFSAAKPGPLPGLAAGQTFTAAGVNGRLVSPYPGIQRLWFVQFSADIYSAMHRFGRPVRYGYVQGQFDLKHYQTVFANTPGSAEMPSAAYPFTRRILQRLHLRGVQIASIVLHTGVSSLEVEVDEVEQHMLYPEPFCVSRSTAAAVNQARIEGRRVIALGTTVVRALESAWDGYKVRAESGFTRLYIHPQRGVHVVDGLLTGLHDPVTSHLAMLYAVAGQKLIRDAYHEAVAAGYRWHEFGDSHLIIPEERTVNQISVS